MCIRDRNNVPVEHTYTQIGTYEVIVTDITPGRCQDQIILPINTTPFATPSFIWTGDNCTTNAIELTLIDQSIIQQDAAVSWLWELSNGNTSTQQNPTFTITENEAINVSLTINSNSSTACTDTKTMTIPPLLLVDEPRLTRLNTCPESTIALNPNYNPQLQYDWSDNEGITDPTIPNPSVIMNTPTSYLVHISDSLGVCQFDRIVEVDTTNATPVLSLIHI